MEKRTSDLKLFFRLAEQAAVENGANNSEENDSSLSVSLASPSLTSTTDLPMFSSDCITEKIEPSLGEWGSSLFS